MKIFVVYGLLNKRCTMKSIIILFLFINSNFFCFADDFKLSLSNLEKSTGMKLEINGNNAIISRRSHDTNYVYLSSDKGDNWNLIFKEKRSIDLPYSPSIEKISFYNDSSFILGFDTGILITTTDKGKNWKVIIPDSTYRKAAAYDMFVYNKKIYLFNDQIALKADGIFEKWTKIDSPFSFGDSIVYWRLQLTKDGYYKAVIYNSMDSNITFISMNINNNEKEFFSLPSYMQAFFFINKDTGWCYHKYTVMPSKDPTTKAQVIYKTDDGGKSWFKQLDTNLLNSRFTGMEFIDENHGFAYGGWNIIMQTDDGGKNWNLLFPVLSPPLKIGYFYYLKAFDKDNAMFENELGQLILLRRNTTGVFELISDLDANRGGFLVHKGDNIKLKISDLNLPPSLITISGKTLSDNLNYYQSDENNINVNIPTNLSSGFYLIQLDTMKEKKFVKIFIID
jgi:photosystem II stability/assembly factor-like uncharacterized protein